MNPVKLGDIVFELTNDAERCLDQTVKSQWAGKSVSQQMTGGKENIPPAQAAAQKISELIKTKMLGLQGMELNPDTQPSLPLFRTGDSLDQVNRRIKAYEVLSETLGTINTRMAGRLKNIAEEQKNILVRQSEQLQEFDEFKSSYLELARNINNPAFNFEALSPQDKLLCFELTQDKDRLISLEPSLFQSAVPDPDVEALKNAIAKLERAPFIESYRQFYRLKDSIGSMLGQESDVEEIYLKKLIESVDRIKPVMAHFKLELVQGQLKSSEDKTIFYCMVKLQDEIQALYQLMHQHHILERSIKEPGLAKLAELAAQLAPLKPLITKTAPVPVEVPPLDRMTLGEAENAYQLALTESNPSKAQEHFWNAARGFWENGQAERALQVSREACGRLSISSSHPLHNFEAILADKSPLGRDFSGVGGCHLKEQSVHMTNCFIDGKPTLRFDCKLNNQGRRRMEAALRGLDRQLLEKNLPAGFCQSVNISKRNSHHYLEFKDGQFTAQSKYEMPGTHEMEVEFVGVGKVIIGLDPENKALYNTINVDIIPQGSPAEQMAGIHTMLTMLGCPPVLTEPTLEDRQRRAVLHVYRCFDPEGAYLLERDPKTYALNPKELLEAICSRNAAMKSHYQEYLNKELLPMREQESSPGKRMTAIDLSGKLRAQGALGLMHGMSGTAQVLAPRVSSMLKSGLVASQRRYQAGIIAAGLSSHKDHQEGGAEGVFTRMVTHELAQSNPISKFAASGTIQFLIGLEAISGANSYGFEGDNYGSRKNASYQHRRNLMDLTAELQRPSHSRFGRPLEVAKFGTANEVIIRDQILPEHIKGIVVQSQSDKEILIQQLIKDKVLVQRGDFWYYRDIKINDFIRVSPSFNKEMWHAS